MTRLNSLNSLHLYKTGLNIIDQICKKGSSEENCYLGASYVLCALTLVNSNAAEAMPWLYQSVSNAL